MKWFIKPQLYDDMSQGKHLYVNVLLLPTITDFWFIDILFYIIHTKVQRGTMYFNIENFELFILTDVLR